MKGKKQLHVPSILQEAMLHALLAEYGPDYMNDTNLEGYKVVRERPKVLALEFDHRPTQRNQPRKQPIVHRTTQLNWSGNNRSLRHFLVDNMVDSLGIPERHARELYECAYREYQAWQSTKGSPRVPKVLYNEGALYNEDQVRDIIDRVLKASSHRVERYQRPRDGEQVREVKIIKRKVET